MATRRQVREAFYGELETAVSGLVPPSNIGQDDPDSDEDLPNIVHSDSYRKVPMNRGAAPVKVTEGTDGEEEYTYVSMMQARFTVSVYSDDESEKEDIYEALRQYFEAYTHPVKDASSIQSDVHRVEVQDSNSDDLTDRDPVARGDRLAINLGFQRFYTQDVDPTTEVNQSVDADNDGTTDNTYTTT